MIQMTQMIASGPLSGHSELRNSQVPLKCIEVIEQNWRRAEESSVKTPQVNEIKQPNKGRTDWWVRKIDTHT